MSPEQSIAVNVVVVLVTGFGAAYTLYNTRRAARDKMEFDSDRLLLETKVKDLEEDKVQIKAELAETKVELRKVAAELIECRTIHAQEKAKTEALQDRVTTLEKMVVHRTTPWKGGGE